MTAADDRLTVPVRYVERNPMDLVVVDLLEWFSHAEITADIADGVPHLDNNWWEHAGDAMHWTPDPEPTP